MDKTPLAALKPKELARAADISVPYAWQILNRKRVPPLPMAIRIFRASGVKCGPLENATDEQAETLSDLEAAP